MAHDLLGEIVVPDVNYDSVDIAVWIVAVFVIVQLLVEKVLAEAVLDELSDVLVFCLVKLERHRFWLVSIWKIDDLCSVAEFDLLFFRLIRRSRKLDTVLEAESPSFVVSISAIRDSIFLNFVFSEQLTEMVIPCWLTVIDLDAVCVAHLEALLQEIVIYGHVLFHHLVLFNLDILECVVDLFDWNILDDYVWHQIVPRI